MALIAELSNRKTIYVYEPMNCSLYEMKSKYDLDKEIDDFHIDRHNRLYPIIDNCIYALRNEYKLLAKDFIEYQGINSDYGCLFFYTQMCLEGDLNKKGNKCVLMCRDVETDIMPERILMYFEHEKYKMMIINTKNYVLYFENNVHIFFKSKYTKMEFAFKTICSCYLEERLILLDTDYNVQMFNLADMKLITGFKSIGMVYSIISSKFSNLIALSTENGVFCIDIKNRSIIKKKLNNEMQFSYKKMKFLDRRTLLLMGDGIVEFNLGDNNLYCVMDYKKDGFFKHFYESQGYILNTEFVNVKKCQCKCYNILLGFKIEVRRDMYALNKKIMELEREIKAKDKLKE